MIPAGGNVFKVDPNRTGFVRLNRRLGQVLRGGVSSGAAAHDSLHRPGNGFKHWAIAPEKLRLHLHAGYCRIAHIVENSAQVERASDGGLRNFHVGELDLLGRRLLRNLGSRRRSSYVRPSREYRNDGNQNCCSDN